MKIKEAEQFVKISTSNSKMPGSSFATDSFACNVGDRLAKVEGSVCSKCYARRIQKFRPNVHKAWKANLDNYRSSPREFWVEAASILINKRSKGHHRWFDSGDLDSLEMLEDIVKVAKATPEVKHWLPTREIKLIQRFTGDLPDNLVIRVSSPMIGMKPLNFKNTSTVHVSGTGYEGHQCPAPDQGNSCGDCRSCWDSNVSNISYRKH